MFDCHLRVRPDLDQPEAPRQRVARARHSDTAAVVLRESPILAPSTLRRTRSPTRKSLSRASTAFRAELDSPSRAAWPPRSGAMTPSQCAKLVVRHVARGHCDMHRSPELAAIAGYFRGDAA